MTLLAAFKIHGVPVLIGDFLLTDELPGGLHEYLPTRPEKEGVTPKLGERRISGRLKKKICHIGNGLVVGFSGQVKPGKYLLRQLDTAFGDHTPSIQSLQKFLSDLRFARKIRTELIGWICEQSPVCFHWKGREPDRLEIVDEVFSGSGGKHFRERMNSSEYSKISPNFRTPYQKAIYIGTCAAGNVLFNELNEGDNLQYNYGFGAEMLLWDGEHFRYNKKVAFSFWYIIIDDDNKLVVAPWTVSAAYENHGSYSAMQVVHFEPNRDGTGLQEKDAALALITSIHKDLKGLDPSDVQRISMESSLWYSGILVTNPKTGKHGQLSMVSECSENIESFVSYENEILTLNLVQLKSRLPSYLFN